MDFPLGLDFPMDAETSAETADIAEETPSSADEPEISKKYRMMLSMWLSFCIIGFVWFVTKVLKGRQRIKYNFSSIEEQLKRMQAVIEERERAMAENASASGADPTRSDESAPKVSPDAQKLLESLTKAFGQTGSDDNLANVDESEETDLNQNVEVAEEVATKGGSSNAPPQGSADEASASRRRKPIDNPLDARNVELLRDTIEDIILAGVKEVGAQSGAKDD